MLCQIVGWFGDTSGNHGYLATPDCTNQVTVNGFTSQTTTGLDPSIFANSLTLSTQMGMTPGISFGANITIAQGLAPIPEIHIKYIQNVTGWTGSVVYQPQPDLLASLCCGATLPLLDRNTNPPPPFYDTGFNETNPDGPNRIVTANDSPEANLRITLTGPDRRMQSAGLRADFTMYLGCIVGGDQTFPDGTLLNWRTLSTMDWVVRYTGTLNPGSPPTFTQGADAGINIRKQFALGV